MVIVGEACQASLVILEFRRLFSFNKQTALTGSWAERRSRYDVHDTLWFRLRSAAGKKGIQQSIHDSATPPWQGGGGLWRKCCFFQSNTCFKKISHLTNLKEVVGKVVTSKIPPDYVGTGSLPPLKGEFLVIKIFGYISEYKLNQRISIEYQPYNRRLKINGKNWTYFKWIL